MRRLRITQRPFLVVFCNLLVHEVDRNRAQITRQVIEQKAWHANVGTCMGEPAIITEVAPDNLTSNPVVHLAIADWIRFEEQQHSPRRVRIEVIFAPNVVNQIVASDHLAKYATRARFDKAAIDECSFDASFLLLVLGYRLPVDKQYPIQVASGRYFLASDRSKHDQARALRGEGLLKFSSAPCCGVAGCPACLPINPNPCFEFLELG
jgi:hypothetical protein